MATHSTSTVRAYGLLDTTADWLLDRRGSLYGDEQERLRRYEGLAVAATVQGVLIPWLAVLALALWGHPVAPAMILVLVGTVLPTAFAGGYATRWRVRTVPDRWSPKEWLLRTVSWVPYLIATLQIIAAFRGPRSVIVGGIVGGVIGVVLGFFARQGRRLREHDRDLNPTDRG
jgi:membrane glycosyltransferase